MIFDKKNLRSKKISKNSLKNHLDAIPNLIHVFPSLLKKVGKKHLIKEQTINYVFRTLITKRNKRPYPEFWSVSYNFLEHYPPLLCPLILYPVYSSFIYSLFYLFHFMFYLFTSLNHSISDLRNSLFKVIFKVGS